MDGGSNHGGPPPERRFLGAESDLQRIDLRCSSAVPPTRTRTSRPQLDSLILQARPPNLHLSTGLHLFLWLLQQDAGSPEPPSASTVPELFMAPRSAEQNTKKQVFFFFLSFFFLLFFLSSNSPAELQPDGHLYFPRWHENQKALTFSVTFPPSSSDLV